jgi:hypothetical protein
MQTVTVTIYVTFWELNGNLQLLVIDSLWYNLSTLTQVFDMAHICSGLVRVAILSVRAGRRCV